MVFKDGERWVMDARAGGATHHIDLDEKPGDTEPEAAMHVLLEGISRSTPHIPTAHMSGKDS
jgi:hypothetical protein